MKKDVLHIDVPSFPATVEQAANLEYRDRPVVVTSGAGSRAIVLSASMEAKREGIGKGMFLKQALKMEQHVIVVDANPELYQRAMGAITKKLAHYSPYVEPVKYGQIAVDMTGTTRLFGRVKNSAYRMHKEIRESLRLTSSVGISVNKLVSSVAARYIRRYAELFDVLPGNERTFLEPLDVAMLPGVGHSTDRLLLEELNICTIGMLAGVPVNKLVLVVGKIALTLHQKAMGIDDSPVLPPQARPEIKEEYTFSEDTNDDLMLVAVVAYLIEQGCARLRKQHKKSNRVRIFCRYSDSKVSARTLQLTEPTHDEYLIQHRAWKIFEKLFERRTRVRYLSIAFENLIHSARQTTLFGQVVNPEAEKHRQLYQAMDRIRNRHGYVAVQFGKTYPLAVAS